MDKNQQILDKAYKGIGDSLKRIAKKKHAEDAQVSILFFLCKNFKAQDKLIETTLGKITLSSAVDKAVTNADLVIEAIVENVEAKQKLFTEIENNSPKYFYHFIIYFRNTLLATNTSSLKLADIGEKLSNRKNFAGLHFFNPVPIMKLLEVN